MTATTPWWEGLAPIETSVPCGKQSHRLRWVEGELLALDHPSVEKERTLATLAGQRLPCLDILDAWARHATDVRVLTLGSRGPTDTLVPQEDPMGPGPGTLTRRLAGPRLVGMRSPRGMGPSTVYGSASSAVVTAQFLSAAPTGKQPPIRARMTRPAVGQGGPDEKLIALLSLGSLTNRLTAGVASHWAEQLRLDDGGGPAQAALQAALHGRVTAALRAWLGRADLRIDVTMVPESDPAGLAQDGDGLAVQLPFAWLADVWARGLSMVWGRFALAAVREVPNRVVLSTVGVDLGAPQPMTVELAAPE